MENQNIEYKQSWRDEYIKWICGFANTNGGKLVIGVGNDGRIKGLSDIAIEDAIERLETAIFDSSAPHIIPKLYAQCFGEKRDTLFINLNIPGETVVARAETDAHHSRATSLNDRLNPIALAIDKKNALSRQRFRQFAFLPGDACHVPEELQMLAANARDDPHTWLD